MNLIAQWRADRKNTKALRQMALALLVDIGTILRARLNDPADRLFGGPDPDTWVKVSMFRWVRRDWVKSVSLAPNGGQTEVELIDGTCVESDWTPDRVMGVLAGIDQPKMEVH